MAGKKKRYYDTTNAAVRVPLLLSSAAMRRVEVLGLSLGQRSSGGLAPASAVSQQDLLRNILGRGLEAFEAEERDAGRLAVAERQYAAAASPAVNAPQARPAPPPTATQAPVAKLALVEPLPPPRAPTSLPPHPIAAPVSAPGVTPREKTWAEMSENGRWQFAREQSEGDGFRRADVSSDEEYAKFVAGLLEGEIERIESGYFERDEIEDAERCLSWLKAAQRRLREYAAGAASKPLPFTVLTKQPPKAWETPPGERGALGG